MSSLRSSYMSTGISHTPSHSFTFNRCRIRTLGIPICSYAVMQCCISTGYKSMFTATLGLRNCMSHSASALVSLDILTISRRMYASNACIMWAPKPLVWELRNAFPYLVTILALASCTLKDTSQLPLTITNLPSSSFAG